MEALKTRPMQCFGKDQNLFSTKTNLLCAHKTPIESGLKSRASSSICLGRHTNTKTTIPEFTGDEVAVGVISCETDGLLCSLISVVGVCCTNEGGQCLSGAASGEGRGDRRAEG